MSYKNLEKLKKEGVDVRNDLEFYTFMINNNKLLLQTEYWYVVENCKHKHPTAFIYRYCEHLYKLDSMQIWSLQSILRELGYGCSMYINADKDKTISRLHVHFPKSLKDVKF